MTTKLVDHARMSGNDGLQYISYMDTGNRTRRTFQSVFIIRREYNHWAMQALLQSSSHNTDDTLMPGSIHQADAEAILAIVGIDAGQLG